MISKVEHVYRYLLTTPQDPSTFRVNNPTYRKNAQLDSYDPVVLEGMSLDDSMSDPGVVSRLCIQWLPTVLPGVMLPARDTLGD